MNRCPVCRAKNRGESTCRRCRSDLSELLTLEARADYSMILACKYLQEGNLSQARRFCTYASRLQRTEFREIFGDFLEDFEV